MSWHVNFEIRFRMKSNDHVLFSSKLYFVTFTSTFLRIMEKNTNKLFAHPNNGWIFPCWIIHTVLLSANTMRQPNVVSVLDDCFGRLTIIKTTSDERLVSYGVLHITPYKLKSKLFCPAIEFFSYILLYFVSMICMLRNFTTVIFCETQSLDDNKVM